MISSNVSTRISQIIHCLWKKENMYRIEAMEEKVLEIISKTLNIPLTDICHDDRLVDIAADSIKLFELLIALESEFGMQVDYSDVADIETVRQIFTYINNLKNS